MPPKRWKRNYISLLVLGTFILLFIIGITIVWKYTEREIEKKDAQTSRVDYPYLDLPDTTNKSAIAQALVEKGVELDDFKDDPCFLYTFLLVEMVLTQVDMQNSIFRARLSFTPCGDLLDLNVISFGKGIILGAPVNITIDDRQYFLPAGKPPQVQEHVSNFDSGTLNSYPIDVWTVEDIVILGEYFNPYTNQIEDLSSIVEVKSFESSFTYKVIDIKDLSDPPNSGMIVSFDLQVRRSLGGMFFSALIMAIMWALSLLAFFVAITMWTMERTVEPPMLGMTIAIVFALPNIRNVQPGNPPMGCNSDMISFIWAMILASSSAGILILNYIYNLNVKKPPKPTPPVAVAPAPPKVEMPENPKIKETAVLTGSKLV
ncbi:hypothetical protein HDU96_000794 [Phlyctochytrium bullatum]|nr:hypothetical protein HDU96_000794 [Phlyctochytrium bullatum]